MNTFEKSQKIKNNDLKATENLENFIATIEKNNPSINAFLEVNKESALSQAKKIDEKIKNGLKVGSLAGLVFGIKANINVEDRIISAASKTLENYYGSYDATVIKKIKEQDGIIIGMCNMDEFAAGSSTESSYFGATENPAAPGHIPGGSSGGSAAAIASEMCDITLGSDTGGSIRNPASHCGVIGFKPTYGAVSRQGLLDLSMSLDQIGPLSDNVSGISMALDTIVGYDETECTSLNQKFSSFTDIATQDREKLQEDVKDMKVLCINQFKDVTDEHINKIIDESVDKIGDMGAEVVESSFDYIDLCLPTYYLINYVEFFSSTRKYDGRKYGHKIEDVCGEEVLRRIEMGSYISQQEFSGKYYKKALQARSLIRNEINKILSDVDLILGPTVPKLPHKIGEKLEPMEMYAYDVLTVIANLAGIPAGSMKAGEYNGIPVGLQLQAKPNDDDKIIKTMAALESL
ncbi:aspartyl/glutamyl-tRNA amidotransferase subunit A [Methanobrevibacter arboriphilus]|jgi:aspartyl-tRNA(Asn)/glutamyl-tRNA(Gln) amidotransferase subunit A|uniref:Aspartyl/glutamyl-tRNA amidotransferase subunit A n=1 Tax=Methanobrevibacter arboriphilus TaxID=39441 RepID=A0ACA8R3U9_METAZ|nr:Asp-tRNA(Asn)/Glu-tRNA(Gln) amidotransferase subunit GatA [Methanobrevibacter arboriphilus]BBL62088.1 aspartyl/glutamyl-tRNA amidotransferase subunit A [Methanobrevibacter arboriphilus]GLI11880.1 aspartyl/glutamyl-tRNA amidotransferase subunit A [Methanobrevibacter arboriphilus]